jgi:phosphoribosylformylglycinamidine synthase subunit PurQ / glutaminase
MAPRVAVVRFPGSNCDLDALQALRSFPRVNVDLVWHEEETIGGYDAVVVPGGFSFGDFLRAGAIAARSPAMEQIESAAEHGKPVLGICNGFQILIEAGLLPGALLRNSSLRFVCRWVNVRVENSSTRFTKLAREGEVLHLPIAHNEGRFYASKPDLKKLASEGKVIFRYCDEKGRTTPSSNPTGTEDNVAGICNKEGNVVGLMPHPERATDPLMGPFNDSGGALIFESMLEGI